MKPLTIILTLFALLALCCIVSAIAIFTNHLYFANAALAVGVVPALAFLVSLAFFKP